LVYVAASADGYVVSEEGRGTTVDVGDLLELKGAFEG
jgi:hypothetical protein